MCGYIDIQIFKYKLIFVDPLKTTANYFNATAKWLIKTRFETFYDIT